MSQSFRRHLLVIAIYLLLAIIFTYPLITQFSTHMLGAKLDNYEYAWKLWWVAHALTHGQSPFFNPNIYFPYGYQLAYGEISPFHTFLMLPFTLAFGEIITYNLAVIGSTVLSGWFMFILARRWFARLLTDTDARLVTLSAFFSGAAFAFCLYRQQKLMGQLNLFETEWLVLTLFAFDRWLEQRQRRYAVLTAFAISLSALTSWYYAFILGLLLPVYLFGYGVNPRRFIVDRRTWQALALVAVIVGALCIPFLIPYLSLNNQGGTFVPLHDAEFWAASLTDYLVPNPLHPLWGQSISRIVWPFPSPMITEFVISISLIVLLLGLYGARMTKGSQWRALKWMIIGALVFSLGPTLYLSRLPLGFPLPDLLLRLILPGASSIRSWGRFSVFVALGFSLLAGAGLLIALANARRLQSFWLRAAVIVIVLALFCFELWTGPHGTVAIEPRRIDLWLAQQPDDAPLMEFPLSAALSGPGMYYTRFHGKPVTFGYGTYLPFIYREQHPSLLTFPSNDSLNQLQEWGVHYILVTTDTLEYENFTLAQVDAQPRLRHIITLDNVEVYRLEDK